MLLAVLGVDALVAAFLVVALVVEVFFVAVVLGFVVEYILF